jgi:hypothetical protein
VHRPLGLPSFAPPDPTTSCGCFPSRTGASGQDVQTIVPQIRAATSAQRALSYAGRGLLILRGTAAQMAAAEHLVQELDKP